MRIKYLKGDATNPIKAGGSHRRVIVHCCNDIGGWGRGFVMALSKKWKYVEECYRMWHKSGINFGLGEIQVVPIRDDNIYVCNMIGQEGIYNKKGIPPIRYDAIRDCLKNLVQKVDLPEMPNSWSLHAPRFGAGLAGGDWLGIEKIILEEIPSHVPVYIYDLPDEPEKQKAPDKIKQVLILRKDLKNKEGHKIRTGKLIAQGAHAAMKVFFDRGHLIYNISEGSHSLEIPLTREMKKWYEDLFTKITLAVKSRDELLSVYQDAVDEGLPVSLITDSGLTEFSEPTDTGIAIGPAKSEDIDKITGHLPLY